MDALILAAGLGSRLRALSDCKPLTRVCGVPLIELAIRSLARAGARRIVVATGYQAERVEAVLPTIGRDVGVPVIAERVSDFTRPNGYSVMAGAARIEGDYLLVMADHLLSWRILCDLSGQGAPDRGVTLAVDRRIDHPALDPEDATWVSTGGDRRIRRIGKTLSAFDAVDCGAFLATPELSAAIAAAISAGKPGSLSDGMQILADKGRAATMDIGARWWIDVDDPASHARAEAGLPGWLADLPDRVPPRLSQPSASSLAA
jgi:1L-myo-inositol 1-phosphate cytidylyltransferase